MLSFHENLKSIIEKKGLNTVSFGEIMGVSAGAVGFWQNGARFPKAHTIEKIIESLDITAIELFGDITKQKKQITIQELTNNLEEYIDHIPNITLPPNIKRVPFNHGFPSTNKIVMENNMQNAEHIYIDKLMLSKEYQEQELKAVIMMGDAMSPYLEHGDVAIYVPTKAYSVKGKYIISSVDGLEVTNVEKLKKCGSLVLKPENQIYSTETFALKEQDLIEFVGIVIGRVSRS